MARGVKAFLTVTAQELLDALRSRRALIFLVLYLLGAISSSVVFINVLHRVEIEAVKAMGITPSEIPGSTTETLWKSTHFRSIMHGLIDDHELMDKLLAIPPVALFYGWLSFTFTPLLVIMLSSSRIAEEVQSGAVRFALFRTSRASWCLGKFAGQALLLFAALLASGFGAWLSAAIRMDYFQWGPGAWHIFLFSLKAWLYACAFLGLALGLSQLVRSHLKATALGLFALIGVTILHGMYHVWHREHRVWELVYELIPQGHKMALWNPDPAELLPAVVMLAVLSLAYLFAGYAVFSRRDV